MTSTCGRYDSRTELLAIRAALIQAKRAEDEGREVITAGIVHELQMFAVWVRTDVGVRQAFARIKAEPATAADPVLVQLCALIDERVAAVDAHEAQRDAAAEQREALAFLRKGKR
jgi:hypothetical protein